MTPEAWDGLLTEEDEMINEADIVGDSDEAVDAEDQDGDDEMQEAVEPEKQADEEPDDNNKEEEEEDNAVEIEELRGTRCSGRRRTKRRRLVEGN